MAPRVCTLVLSSSDSETSCFLPPDHGSDSPGFRLGGNHQLNREALLLPRSDSPGFRLGGNHQLNREALLLPPDHPTEFPRTNILQLLVNGSPTVKKVPNPVTEISNAPPAQ